VFKAWFVTEAGWRHNRIHLFLAAVALVLVFAQPNIATLIVATVMIGSLMLRVYLWDLRRTDTRLALQRIPRHDSHS
jgi:hypothetical protein